MKDVFVEHIVKRRKGISDYFKSAMILLAAFCVLFIVYFFAGIVFPVTFLIVVWGTYVLITNRNLEYEYILTNAALDIDRIYAKRRRRRVINVDLNAVEGYGVAGDEGYAKILADKTAMLLDLTSNVPDTHRIYFVMPRPKRRYLVVIEPSGELEEAVAGLLPRNFRR